MRKISMLYGVATLASGVKKPNQDNYWVNETFLKNSSDGFFAKGHAQEYSHILGVFDGFGDKSEGFKATSIATTSFSHCSKLLKLHPNVNPLEFLAPALFDINDKILKSCHSEAGSTVASLCISGKKTLAFNLGSSSSFLFRDNKLTQLSTSHVRDDKLEQFLGLPPKTKTIKPYATTIETHDGDIFVLCSDGFSNAIGRQDITEILKSGVSPDKMAEKLLKTALTSGLKDSATVIVASVSFALHKVLLLRQLAVALAGIMVLFGAILAYQLASPPEPDPRDLDAKELLLCDFPTPEPSNLVGSAEE